ncbi:MAG: 50S ribosomal protein L22 [Candidatus Babeliales bacterium]
MQRFVAKAKFIPYSPFKLRPLVDVVRGKSASFALNWLATLPMQRAVPIKKVIDSAVANARSLQNVGLDELAIKDIRVDGGPITKYFNPGAMGRSRIQRKRKCHISVVLERKVKEPKKETKK